MLFVRYYCQTIFSSLNRIIHNIKIKEGIKNSFFVVGKTQKGRGGACLAQSEISVPEKLRFEEEKIKRGFSPIPKWCHHNKRVVIFGYFCQKGGGGVSFNL